VSSAWWHLEALLLGPPVVHIWEELYIYIYFIHTLYMYNIMYVYIYTYLEALLLGPPVVHIWEELYIYILYTCII
jgi:hypothetical protein